MVTEHKYYRKCGSEHIVKNGSNSSRNPKYKCKACGFGGVFQTVRKSEEFKELVASRQPKKAVRPGGLPEPSASATKLPLGGLKKKPNPCLTL